jgi:site-specific DNA-adenine methylase
MKDKLPSILAVIIAMLFLAVVIIDARPKLVEPDQYFICCVEKLAQEYYTVVYMKNGETFYPHFTHERQVHAFIEELERLGELNRNGYEVAE